MKEHYINKILCGDAKKILSELPEKMVSMCVTSPPYYNLRDYEEESQLGNEKTDAEYISKLCDIFDEVYKVLADDGTLWVNIADTYKNKELLNIPSKFVIEMCNRGWKLRNEIIWYKPNAMPCSAKDRFTIDYEKVFFFAKDSKYYFEQQKEPSKDSYGGKRGSSKTRKKFQSAMQDTSDVVTVYKERNVRCVWEINTEPFKGNHFATYPTKLVEVPIKSGCPEGGLVLDPFMGSGTTGLVARRLNRNYLGIDLNPEYVELANKRILEDGDSELQ